MIVVLTNKTFSQLISLSIVSGYFCMIEYSLKKLLILYLSLYAVICVIYSNSKPQSLSVRLYSRMSLETKK